MNSLKNKVHLIGHLGRDPEVKHFDGGKSKAYFSLATNESYKDANGKRVEQTEWHPVVAWGKQAEIAEKFLNKGKEVAIEGRLVHRSYDDKEGNRKFITEVVANEIVMVGKKE